MYQEIALKKITPNPHNSRTTFSGPDFDELVKSIASLGVIEPIIVRPKGEGFELVAGERRFRACLEVHKNNGKKPAVIPSLVRTLTDEEAIEFMTVENLQRKNLNELEEARAFQTYLTIKWKDAAEDLASRIGVDPRYIRRRVRVLDLPEKALKMWSEGTLRYGHLEQFLRLGSKGEVLEFLSHGQIYGVDQLRREIDNRAPALKSALFETKKVGCEKCQSNSSLQGRLYGDDFKTDKVRCMNQNCFRKHQAAFLTKNWDPSLHNTRSFRWRDQTSYETWEQIYGPRLKKCGECDDSVTLLSLDGSMSIERVCLKKSCFTQTFRQKVNGTSAPKHRDPGTAPDWHGTFFREEFYKSAIPKIAAPIDPDNYALLHASLVAILQENREAREAFYLKVTGKGDRDMPHERTMLKLWPHIEGLGPDETKKAIKEATLNIILQGTRGEGTNWYFREAHVSPDLRNILAAHLGIDLARDWTLNEDYLKKKTVAEVLKILRDNRKGDTPLADGSSEGFPPNHGSILEDPKAKTYLAGTLKKKTPEACKKTELVDLILKSGVDLSGRVPDEILNLKVRGD